ncbi:MAG: hypothetical protein M3367_19685 [Acidobacteriota bacterium]|nr:hypothetical protein [Acidobacteriota bacterium]
MINRIALLLVLCIVLSAQLNAQPEQFASLAVEYGDLSELVGKNRVFVHSENLESRAKVLKELAKSKYPHFEVVGRIAEADFLLVYGTNLVRNNTTSFTESTGDTNVAYGDMVALRLISNPKAANTLSEARTRIIWYTRKRQMFLRTDQIIRPVLQTKFSGSTKSSLIASLIGTLLFSHPKLAWLPLSRDTEISAVRDFIKALKASEATKLDRRFALPLSRKLASTPPRRQRFP